MLLKFIVVLPLLMAPSPSVASVSAKAVNVLEANAVAMGAPTAGTARLQYSRTSSGLTAPADAQFDLATGAYVEIHDTAGAPSGSGFDGKVPWQEDLSGAFTPQMGGDRLPLAIDTAFRNSNLWWRPRRGEAEISFEGREADGARTFDHLSVTPRGGKRFEAWFDADTHMLARVTYDQQFFHVTESYADYRREGELMLAHRIVRDEGFGRSAMTIAVLTHASVGPSVPSSLYSLPETRPEGASITDGAASTTVPFRLLNNHIYVEATVDGHGPFTFIVDTGGHTLLTPHLVAAVGLKAAGEAVNGGAGEGHTKLGYVRYGEIAIGGVRLTNQMGFASDIYDPAVEGLSVDGMVGFELFRRMAVTIDYGRRSITFIDPAKFRPSNALGARVPFTFYDHMPFVAGSVAGLPAHFDIDTGSRSQVDLTSPFVQAKDLKARFAKGTSAVTGWGVGGPSRSYAVRMPTIKIGSQKIDSVVVGLSEARGGALADSSYDGNIGSGLLKAFVVTFDYPHQAMYLKRIRPAPPDLGTFDRSGLWINASNGGFTVTDVATGSAGADSGIAIGDVITGIDGKPAITVQLADARRLLRERAAGSRINLDVRRGGEIRSVTLILKDQI